MVILRAQNFMHPTLIKATEGVLDHQTFQISSHGENGSDTLVKFDSDGGGNNYITLATVKNVQLTSSSVMV